MTGTSTIRPLPLALLVATALVLAACGGGGSGDATASGGSPTAPGGSATSVGGSPTITTDSSDAGAAAATGGGDLTGAWEADAGDLLAANMANIGGTGGGTCTGILTMTFTDGSFQRVGTATCGPDEPITVTIDTSGNYSTDGDTLTVSNTSARSSGSVGGMSIPFGDSFGDGTATYVVDGDELRITFEELSVGRVTQTYRRA